MLRIWKRLPLNHRAGRSRPSVARLPAALGATGRPCSCWMGRLFPGNPSPRPPEFLGRRDRRGDDGSEPVPGSDRRRQEHSGSTTDGGFRTITWDGVKLDGTDFGGRAEHDGRQSEQDDRHPQESLHRTGGLLRRSLRRQRRRIRGRQPERRGPVPGVQLAQHLRDDQRQHDRPVVQPSDREQRHPRARGHARLRCDLPQRRVAGQHDSESRSNTSTATSLLGTFFVPVGTQGQPEFLGELFPSAVVTRVTLTLGTDTLFSFDGVTSTPGTNARQSGGRVITWSPPTTSISPSPSRSHSAPPILSGPAGTLNAQTVVAGTVGAALPATTVVGTFSDTTAAPWPRTTRRHQLGRWPYHQRHRRREMARAGSTSRARIPILVRGADADQHRRREARRHGDEHSPSPTPPRSPRPIPPPLLRSRRQRRRSTSRSPSRRRSPRPVPRPTAALSSSRMGRRSWQSHPVTNGTATFTTVEPDAGRPFLAGQLSRQLQLQRQHLGDGEPDRPGRRHQPVHHHPRRDPRAGAAGSRRSTR